MAEANVKEKKKVMPSNLLNDTNQKKKKKSSRRQDPSNIQLPLTPELPTANVKLPWLEESVPMRILLFYHSKPHIFGCQFSNLFYSPFQVNTRWLVPTADGTTQTLMRYEITNIEEKNENFASFQSSESVFQAAKAQHKKDALFVQSLSPGDAARAGQARLKMSNGLANKYKKFGGDPFKISANHWQFSETNKRYKRRANWHNYKVEIMNYALRLKFAAYYNLISEYVDSKVPIYFVEHTKNDRQWADGEDGKGTNYLGKLLTALCWEFRLRKERESKENIDDDKNNKAEKPETKEDDKDRKNVDGKWNIDTTDDVFLKWMAVDNIDVIANGAQFYQQHSKCEWLT